jgi:serine/threonine protein kinase
MAEEVTEEETINYETYKLKLIGKGATKRVYSYPREDYKIAISLQCVSNLYDFKRVSELEIIISKLRTDTICPFVPLVHRQYYVPINDVNLNKIGEFDKDFKDFVSTFKENASEDDETFIGISELEFFEGGTLKSMMTKPIRKEIRLNLMFEICYGLFCLQHELELLHVDLKPENVFIYEEEKNTAYLLETVITKEKNDIENSYMVNSYKNYPTAMIGDFDASKKLFGFTIKKNKAKFETNWEIGTAIYNNPFQLFFLEPLAGPSFKPIRGPDNDVWNFGHIVCALMLNGWKIPDNVLGHKYFKIDHIVRLFLLPEKKEDVIWDKALEFAEELIQDMEYDTESVIVNGIAKDSEKDKIKRYIVYAMADCQLQHYLGLGFMPDLSMCSVNVPNSTMKTKEQHPVFDIIGERFQKEKDHILALGCSFTTEKENIFKLAVKEIENRYGGIGLDFLRRHLGWLPEQRRAHPAEILERGEFLKISLMHPLFKKFQDDLSKPPTKKIDEELLYTIDLGSDSKTRLLGKSIDPEGNHYLSFDYTNKMGHVKSLLTQKNICNHTIDKDTLIKWNVEVKDTHQKICPLCEVMK